jgi:hypothetical protein
MQSLANLVSYNNEPVLLSRAEAVIAVRGKVPSTVPSYISENHFLA